LLSFCDYPTITAEKFEGGQNNNNSFVIVKGNKIKITVITHSYPAKLRSIRAAVMH